MGIFRVLFVLCGCTRVQLGYFFFFEFSISFLVNYIFYVCIFLFVFVSFVFLLCFSLFFRVFFFQVMVGVMRRWISWMLGIQCRI